jgi:hypothetical protein
VQLGGPQVLHGLQQQLAPAHWAAGAAANYYLGGDGGDRRSNVIPNFRRSMLLFASMCWLAIALQAATRYSGRA